MSDTNRYTGAITIDPPLTATQIRDAPVTTDARLRVSEQITRTDTGEVVVRTAAAIEAACDGFSGYHLVEDIQRLAGHAGPGHTFGGWIEVHWDPGYEEPVPQRYVIRGGQVETVTPELTWPDPAPARAAAGPAGLGHAAVPTREQIADAATQAQAFAARYHQPGLHGQGTSHVATPASSAAYHVYYSLRLLMNNSKHTYTTDEVAELAAVVIDPLHEAWKLRDTEGTS